MDIFKRLLLMAKQYYLRFILAAVCMVIAGGLQSALPLISKPVIDDIFMSKNIEALKWIPFVIIAIFLFKGLANYGQNIIMSSIGLRIVTDLRNKLYAQIQKQSLSFFAEHPTGLLMSRITNDVQSVQTASSEAITALVKDSFMLVSLVGVIFTDWKLALIAMAVFPLTIYPISRFGKNAERHHTPHRSPWGL